MIETPLKVKGSSSVEIGACVMLASTLAPVVLINGSKYLRSGYVEDDPKEFNTDVFNIKGWVGQETSFGGNGINDIAYGNGLFVAVGSGAKIATSTDGINWTQRNTPFSSSIYAVTYGNGLFIAVGKGTAYTKQIATSPDGINWTQRKSNFGSYNYYGTDVVYGNELFVAVGSMKSLSTSPDGINWTNIPVSGLESGTFNDVAYGNGLFIAVSSSGQMATSPDGINWSAKESLFGNYSISSIAYGDELFVAIGVGAGGASNIATSFDGINWTMLRLDGVDSLRTVIYMDGLFLAGGKNGKLATSIDGATWIPRVSTFTGDITCSINVNDQVLIFGADGLVGLEKLYAGNPLVYSEGSSNQYVRTL